MITDEEFNRIAVFMKKNYGVDMTEKKIIVNGRLERRLGAAGFKSYDEFINAVESGESEEPRKLLVNLLTTNHTYFMREFEHFEYFKRVVLPWLKVKESRRKDLRIWCGAASTGEEPYMIAMVLADFFGLERDQWDTKVLATDISTKVLQKAVAGIYSAEQLEKLPEQWKRHFFSSISGGEQFRVKDELKKEVIFRQFNLMNPFPFKRKMHTIFLRNVMIYFDDRTKVELLRKVYDILEPGGYLFIGTTETLDRNVVPFQIIQPSIFRKREGKE